MPRLSRSEGGLARYVSGEGPSLVLVHGSAMDGTGWATQVAQLSSRYRILVYDRRGTERSPVPEGCASWSVEAHAEDLCDLIRAELSEPPLAVGSSFGAVCVLEAARRAPSTFRAAVLIEPPLPESDAAPPVPESFMGRFEALCQAEGGPAAAAFFLRTVLGKADFERLPERWKARACALHAQIHLECQALLDYRPRFAELGALDLPVLLVGGGRSAPHFRATLHALQAALPRAELELLPSAGHMLHAEAGRSFARRLISFDPSVFEP